jgi:hypothetical protein
MNFRKEEPFVFVNETPVINLKNYLEFSTILVETGTSDGRGVQNALDFGYTDVRSVEMVEERFEYCTKRFESEPRVKLWLGDSRDNIADMIPEEKCIILLDAHPSGEGSAGHNDLMEKGQLSDFHQEKILVSEIKIALNNPNRNIIILDDTKELDPIYTSLFDNYRFEIIGDKFLECIPAEI